MYIKPEDIEKFIYDNELATEAEVRLVCQISGWSTDTLNKIINCRTEYQDIEQIHACEPDNYSFGSVESYFEEEDEDDYPEDDDGWDAYVMSNAYGPDDC
jgi:hypothetical protein